MVGNRGVYVDGIWGNVTSGMWAELSPEEGMDNQSCTDRIPGKTIGGHLVEKLGIAPANSRLIGIYPECSCFC